MINSTTTIGLLDYDLLRTKNYIVPNYDVGVIYAYYKNNRNISIRLISSLSYNNLNQYDKIYLFKTSKSLPHPSGLIKNYYKLPIEEYGMGFINKPYRPFILETREICPDFTCYNNMLKFSLDRPNHPLAWRINKNAKGKKYSPIRLYEKLNDEILKKDYPITTYNVIYDDPVDLLNDTRKKQYLEELIEKGHHFYFAQSLDISRINDTNILSQVLQERKFASLRKRLCISDIRKNTDFILEGILSGEYHKNIRAIAILDSSDLKNYFTDMLIINYYNHKSKGRILITPVGDRSMFKENTFILSLFNYLNKAFRYMSFYEYIANISFMSHGVPKELIHTGEDRFEYIFKNYGTPHQLNAIEKWIERNPLYEDCIFIGGSSDYKKIRETYCSDIHYGFNIREA